MLGFFKYWNFVGTNISGLLQADFQMHELLLPIGLSFYTFQSLGHCIDVYFDRVKRERHFGQFSLFISFFPQVVAGPIERSQSLLPQLKNLRLATIHEFRYGILLIVWGLFLKLVISDNLTTIISSIYFSEMNLSFLFYWLAGFLVTFKVYCDFMGYSEIARGLGRLFGIKLTMNFRRPLLAANLNDFWQRWHITLTRWIGVYVHMPLAKRFPGVINAGLVTVFTMTMVGLWHGASWNFIVFGLYHGLMLALWKPCARFFQQLFNYSGRVAAVLARITMLFIFVTGGTLFYISDWDRLQVIFFKLFDLSSLVEIENGLLLNGKFTAILGLFGIGLLTIYSLYTEYRKTDVIDTIAKSNSMVRWSVVVIFCMIILFMGNLNVQDFVYFEF